MYLLFHNRFLILLMLFLTALNLSAAQDVPTSLTIHWQEITRVSKTAPTLQVVVNPPLRRGTTVHDNAFRALRDLHADYVRYVAWLPYPRLGVAELEAPINGKTSWNFSLIDPMTIDFLEATKGHSVIMNFSTIPQWMFKTESLVPYPADPDQVTWSYEQGRELRDTSFKEIADYYARLLAWYTQGGFVDEFGKRHESGYQYSIPFWEVLNEPDLEHQISAEQYTAIYDRVVAAMLKVQPKMRFVAVSLAYPSGNPHFLEYFLDHKNHRPGAPLDFISYHFYAVPTPDQTEDVQQYTFFTQADGFLNTVRYIESIRQRLSPQTGTMINEIGSISADDLAQVQPGHVTKPVPNSYWNLSGAIYAYIFAELSRIGVDVAGASQLVGFPTQFPSVSMVDWETGKPNARYWVLKLLHDNFGPGDSLVEAESNNPLIHVMALLTRNHRRRVLLINKRNRPINVSIPGAAGGQEEFVDVTTAFQPPLSANLSSDKVTLGGFAVAAITLP